MIKKSIKPYQQFENGKLIEFIKKLVISVFDLDQVSRDQFEEYLVEKSTLDCIEKFTTVSDVKNLIIQLFCLKDSSQFEYFVSNEIEFKDLKHFSLQLIKRNSLVEENKGIHCQLTVITLNNIYDSSPFETLYSYVANTIAPYFNSYSEKLKKSISYDSNQTLSEIENVQKNSNNDKVSDGKFGCLIEKKIAEVEMGLLQLQQRIEIPEIELNTHTYILRIIKKFEKENKKPVKEDFKDIIQDVNFLDELQLYVKKWISEIRKVTRLDRDPSAGTAIQEISFWLNMENELLKINNKRKSFEVILTFDILKYANRLVHVVGFDSDTNLNDTLKIVKNYNLLMANFPLYELTSATDFERIINAIRSIFNHLIKIKNTNYPLGRFLKLIEALSKDLTSQMAKILCKKCLLMITLNELKNLIDSCYSVFGVWQNELDKLQTLIKDSTSRKQEALILEWKIDPLHKKLQSRLNAICNIRVQNEELIKLISKFSNLEKSLEINDNETSSLIDKQILFLYNQSKIENNKSETKEISLVFEEFKESFILDVSEKGIELWETALKFYNEKVEQIETKLTSILNNQLEKTQDSNEMFRIFSKFFDGIFLPSSIKNSLQIYRSKFIQCSRKNIEELQEKFKAEYLNSRRYKMSRARNISPLNSKIIWLKQVEHQLDLYMKKVQIVMNKEW